MDGSGSRQLQFISYCANSSKDFKGAKVFESQFLISSGCQCRLDVRLKFHKHRLPFLELAFRSLLVNMALHTFFSPREMLMDEISHDLMLLKPV